MCLLNKTCVCLEAYLGFLYYHDFGAVTISYLKHRLLIFFSSQQISRGRNSTINISEDPPYIVHGFSTIQDEVTAQCCIYIGKVCLVKNYANIYYNVFISAKLLKIMIILNLSNFHPINGCIEVTRQPYFVCKIHSSWQKILRDMQSSCCIRNQDATKPAVILNQQVWYLQSPNPTRSSLEQPALQIIINSKNHTVKCPEKDGKRRRFNRIYHSH